MRNKMKKALKRYKYIEVKGIDKQYIDACLLAPFELEMLCEAFEDEKRLLAKTNVTVLKLRKRDVTKQQLIREISPHISTSYTLYNYLANISHKAFEMLEEQLEDFHSLTLEEQADTLYEFIENKKISYSTYINWLRFHESLHPRILDVFQTYGEAFEKETGLKLPSSFQMEPEEKREEQEGELYQELTRMIHWLTDVRDRAKKESFKEQYEEKQKEVEQLQRELKTLQNQLDSKEKQLAKQVKEAAKMSKQVEEHQQKMAQKQKEVGQLGQEVGKLRGQVEELTKKNKALEQEIEVKSKQLKNLTHDIEARSEQRFRLEKANMQQTYEERIRELEETVKQLQSSLQHSLEQFEQERVRYEDELDLLRRKVDVYEQMMNEQQAEAKEAASAREQDTKSDDWFDSLFDDLPVSEPEKI